jgi:hypothetical protein
MSRRFALLLSVTALAFVAALIMSCGGSSKSGSTPCTGGPYNVVGPWQITVTDTGGASTTGYGAIDSSGLALFFDNSAPQSTGDTVELPIITGACSFSGNVTAYAEPGGPNSGSVITDTITGNVTSSSAITGSFTGTGGNPSGTISATPFSPLTGSVTAISGSMLGEAEGAVNSQGILISVVFSPSGSNHSMTFATPNNVGCIVNGTFTEQGTSNVFDVSMTFSNTGCALSGTVTGIGFESNTDYFNFNSGAAGTYLYADILNSSNSFVMEFFP